MFALHKDNNMKENTYMITYVASDGTAFEIDRRPILGTVLATPPRELSYPPLCPATHRSGDGTPVVDRSLPPDSPAVTGAGAIWREVYEHLRSVPPADWPADSPGHEPDPPEGPHTVDLGDDLFGLDTGAGEPVGYPGLAALGSALRDLRPGTYPLYHRRRPSEAWQPWGHATVPAPAGGAWEVVSDHLTAGPGYLII